MDQIKASKIKIRLGTVNLVYEDEDIMLRFPNSFRILRIEGTNKISCERGDITIEISAEESKNELKRKIAKYNLLHPKNQIYIV